jgi:hypothetical protein
MTSPAGISFFWLISLPLCDWATSVPASRWGRLSLDKQVVGVRCCSEGGDAQQLLLSESAAQAKQLVAWASDLHFGRRPLGYYSSPLDQHLLTLDPPPHRSRSRFHPPPLINSDHLTTPPPLNLPHRHLLEPRPETNAIPQGQKTTMTLLTEAPVPDLYTLEVVTSRLAEPRTMTASLSLAFARPCAPSPILAHQHRPRSFKLTLIAC